MTLFARFMALFLCMKPSEPKPFWGLPFIADLGVVGNSPFLVTMPTWPLLKHQHPSRRRHRNDACLHGN